MNYQVSAVCVLQFHQHQRFPPRSIWQWRSSSFGRRRRFKLSGIVWYRLFRSFSRLPAHSFVQLQRNQQHLKHHVTRGFILLPFDPHVQSLWMCEFQHLSRAFVSSFILYLLFQHRICDVGVVALAHACTRMACLDLSMCNKLSELALKTVSHCCRALLRLDICGCSLMSRKAIEDASKLLVDCSIKNSLSDESSRSFRSVTWLHKILISFYFFIYSKVFSFFLIMQQPRHSHRISRNRTIEFASEEETADREEFKRSRLSSLIAICDWAKMPRHTKFN
jgi:hypothetical protein